MKTTELFIEQVIIGLVVLLTASWMIRPDFATSLIEVDDISEVAVVIAIAYLVGIVYDRFSDTLLQDLERHHRLSYALSLHDKVPNAHDDPFPEDEWRCRAVLHPEASEYVHYLRSRIRLTRALASLGPAIGMAAALNLADLALIRITGAVATAIVYLAAFAWKIRRRRPCVKVNSRPPEAAEGLTSQGTRVFDLPRTKDLRVEKVRSWYEEMIGEYDKETRYSKLGWRFPLTCEPLVPAALVLALLAGAVAAGTDKPSWVDIVSGAGLALATVIGTAICGWTWWRMSDTLFAFLRTFMLVTKDPPANRARCELA